MTIEEIRTRRLANQFLIEPVPRREAVRGLNGMQAQFLKNALHAIRIRSSDWDAETAADGLVKNWTVRGTVHVFDEDDLPLFLHCSGGRDYRRNEWSGYSFWNRRDTWALTPERQKYLADAILDALKDGEKSREELKAVCRAAGMTEAEEDSMFDPWGGGIRELCERGFMQYTVTEEKRFRLTPDFVPVPEKEAKLEIARRYFTHYGPAAVHDAMYYFHAPAGEVRAWLEELPVTAETCGGRTYYSIPSAAGTGRDAPRCVFLAGFDPLMLGYEKKESFFLAQENIREIFNLAGIVMPAVLWEGLAVGRWKQRNARLTVELFRPVGEDARRDIRRTAESLWPDLKRLDIAE